MPDSRRARDENAIRTVLENHPVVIPAYGEARHKRAVVIEVAEEAKGAFADNSAELADQEACAFPGCGKTQTHIFHAPCPGFHCSRAALFCHDYVPPKHSCA